jgi:sugar phosphate isomerase/epimerase
MEIRGHDIGVCGWSLLPKDAADLVAKVKQLGLSHMQVGLSALLAKPESERAAEIEILKSSGLTITATSVSFPGEDYSTIAMIQRTGGFLPDEHWPQRREMALRAGELTAKLGVKFTELHVGFVPTSSDPIYKVIVHRTREVAQALAGVGVDLLMETGQESGSELLQFLNDLNCRNTGVNFDPANMVLYGTGDPIETISVLNRHVRHIHVKDAIESEQPHMQWGKEVPLGSGQVGVEQFLDALDDIDYTGVLSIERESGNDRMAEIRAAIEVLRRFD